jgi:hypothetical protein
MDHTQSTAVKIVNPLSLHAAARALTLGHLLVGIHAHGTRLPPQNNECWIRNPRWFNKVRGLVTGKWVSGKQNKLKWRPNWYWARGETQTGIISKNPS